MSSGLVGAIGWHLTYLVLAVGVLLSGTALAVPAILWSKRARAHKKMEENNEVEGNSERKEEAEASQLDSTDDKPGEETETEQLVQVPTPLKVGIYIIWTLGSISKCTAYYTPMLTLVR